MFKSNRPQQQPPNRTLMSGHCTFDPLFKIFSWSMKCLKDGLSPMCRHDGSAWTPQDERLRFPVGSMLPRAALLQVRGDWEWLCQCFRFRHFQNENFCWLCDATHTGANSYLNVGPDAPYRQTRVTHERFTSNATTDSSTQFRLQFATFVFILVSVNPAHADMNPTYDWPSASSQSLEQGSIVRVCGCHPRYVQDCIIQRISPSSLFEAPGFKLEYVAPDSMHCGDLGVFQDAIGGLLYVEMSHRPWHSSFAAGVKWLNSQLKLYYSANPGLSRLQLTVSMLKSKDHAFPTLKSKAAECRHLAGFAVAIANRHRNKHLVFRNGRLAPFSAEYRDLVVSMAENLERYHDSCSAEPFVEAGCRESMHGFIQSATGLRALFRRDLAPELHDSQPFMFKIKGHMLEHVVNEKISMWGSPRNFWCYADEDFVGLVKRIAVMTKHPRTLEMVLLKKYRLYSGLHAYALRLANA